MRLRVWCPSELIWRTNHSKAAKDAKAYERAEDPLYVLENNIPLDAKFGAQKIVLVADAYYFKTAIIWKISSKSL